MIGAIYQSDQRIVEIYRDKVMLPDNNESKVPPEKVLDYIELISVTNKSFINCKKLRLRKVS